jgi:uncharacterized membrane protein YciS (DUF1049 family)
MAFVKWAVVFGAAFCAAFIIIVTFSQTPFKQAVPAVIFSYQTKSLAIYWYVVIALATGLAVGLAVALYTWIDLRTALSKKNKTIKELEEKLSDAQIREKATSFAVQKIPEQKPLPEEDDVL